MRIRSFVARWVGLLGVLCALASLASCGGALADTLARRAPERLVDTGLYADLAAKTLAPGVMSFEPQYPLWTDGATKRRWILVPEGAWIDANDPETWVFPAGTKLWKEFAVGRRIETRYLEKLADGGWLRAAYVWSADESDARLAPDCGVRGVAESEPGVPYDVPSRGDCATCHSHGNGVLGFSALQLSPDRDPQALHAVDPRAQDEDLSSLVRRGVLRGLPHELLEQPPRIEAETPRERAVLGYLATHCGTCHYDGGLLVGLDLDLEARIGEGANRLRALATTVDRASRFRPAGAPQSCDVRIRPGDPERSSLLHRMSTRDPLAQMPPVGTRLVDGEAVALIEAWIREDLANRD